MALRKDMQAMEQTPVRHWQSVFFRYRPVTEPSIQTGHTGSMWDGSFAGPGNDDAIIDFAWRALHMTTVVVKSLTTEFYYRPYTKSYFMGCSTGGRQGIKAMSTFPEDYDGLV
jgi:feruloyl esterase